MKNKKVVRLTESQLHSIIAESVNRILNEAEMTDYGNARRYKVRNTDNGYRNFHDIRVGKGEGARGLSYMRFGNGGNDNGQIEEIIGELAEYLGCTPDEVKGALGNLR